MRAFIAGATGYTGQAVVAELQRQGHTPIAHARPASAPRLRSRSPGVEVDTTAWDLDAMGQTLEALSPDLVFCLIGTTKARMRAGDGASYMDVDFHLTDVLARATAQAAPNARFVYVSSMGASADAPGAYMEARWAAEESIRASGLAHVIARPAFITGADRQESRLGESLGALATNAVFKTLGALGARTLERRYRSTDAPELARALIHYALHTHTRERIVEAEDLKDESLEDPRVVTEN